MMLVRIANIALGFTRKCKKVRHVGLPQTIPQCPLKCLQSNTQMGPPAGALEIPISVPKQMIPTWPHGGLWWAHRACCNLSIRWFLSFHVFSSGLQIDWCLWIRSDRLEVKINETDIGDGDSSDDGVEFDEASSSTGKVPELGSRFWVVVVFEGTLKNSLTLLVLLVGGPWDKTWTLHRYATHLGKPQMLHSRECIQLENSGLIGMPVHGIRLRRQPVIGNGHFHACMHWSKQMLGRDVGQGG